STPCSAPFLGQAIGAAMLQPPLGIVLCLTMMGLGMSLPYIILGAFPVLTKYLPKPGAWMESFKQSMSFLMFGTAAYFLWIYIAFFDADNHPQDILFLFFGLVLFSMAFWVYGRWCPMYRSRKSRITGGVFFVIFLLAGLYYMLPPEGAAWFGRGADSGTADSSAATAPARQAEGSVWTPWSPEAMQAALKEGKPVYVDFTARWCSTCQVNKASYTDEVLAAFRKYGIVMMKADKTRTNPAIDQELKNLGRTAVPVNALYLPGKKPIVTRELLSPSYLLEFLETEMDR
ncbi:protein-disulfide reductase DsbD family protein, partial [Akkermansia sp.]